MEKKFLGLAIFVIGILLGSAILVATLTNGENATLAAGSVAVFVYDEKGNPIENATVQLISNTSQIVKSGYTDKNGEIILSGFNNFTGIVKVTAKDYKDAQENITYSGATEVFVFHLEKSSSAYVDKAKNLYDQHKTAVIVGGAVIVLLLVLVAMGNKKKIRW